MTLRMSARSALISLGLTALAAPAFAQATTAPPDHPGRAVYNRACASCHDNPGTTRAATLANMQAQTPARLREVLTTGVMAPMAAGLTPADVTNVIAFLTYGQATAPADWTTALACPADKRNVDLTKAVVSNGFGVDGKQTRSLTAKQAGIKKSQMKDLQVAWAIGLPGQAGGTGATVVGDTLFTSAGQKLLAMDAASGCVKWSYAANSRNTPAFGDIGGRKVVALSVVRDIHVIDARTGELVWKASGQPTDNPGSIRGGVIFHKDKVIVPISASGVGAGSNARFECCVGHGAVVALSAKDGSKLWEYHTMPVATYNGQTNSQGVKQRGPSGAPIWSVPVVDEKRGRIIVTSGENTSHPGTDTSDAVIAIDLNTGREVWKFQAMPADVWNMACSADKATSGPNCPWHFDEGAGRDFDFGAGAIIAKGKGGKDVVLAGQKSGHVWALDAETGKKLWQAQVGEGSALGGVHWGISTDGTRLFAPINDPIPGGPGSKPHPGVYAFDIKSGKQVWGYDAKADCTGDRAKAIANCDSRYGFSAAPLTIDGAVVAATLAGKVYVFDGKNGKVLKEFDTLGPQPTINGVAGKGGSIDAHGVSAGAGMIFINSGYSSFGQTGGNLLIALKPKGK